MMIFGRNFSYHLVVFLPIFLESGYMQATYSLAYSATGKFGILSIRENVNRARFCHVGNIVQKFLLATSNTTLLCRIVMLHILKSIVVDYLDRVYTVPVQLLIRNRSWCGSKVITLLRCRNCTR